jgi:hypothetical protein
MSGSTLALNVSGMSTTTNPRVQSFRDLLVWQRSIELASEVYRLTKTFPREELFGITGQMRRSAVSVGSNISEGAGSVDSGRISAVSGDRSRIEL